MFPGAGHVLGKARSLFQGRLPDHGYPAQRPFLCFVALRRLRQKTDRSPRKRPRASEEKLDFGHWKAALLSPRGRLPWHRRESKNQMKSLGSKPDYSEPARLAELFPVPAGND